MSDPLAEYQGWVNSLVERLGLVERKRLATKLAIDLRRANAKRIADNVDPDGAPFEPRKAIRNRRVRDELTRRKQSVREAKMFRRATKIGYLRRVSTSGEAWVGFVGAMARIMRVHQLGLSDTVTRDPNAPTVLYPARRVIGFTGDDRRSLMDIVLEHVGA